MTFPLRRHDAHKGSVGRVLVVAGSPGLEGAAVLTGEAALRTGAGVVTIACPESVELRVAARTTCVMTRGLSARRGHLGPWSAADLGPLIMNHDALVVGPGLGQARALGFWLRRWLPGLDRPLVLDADGLNAFQGQPEALASLNDESVLTPHPGEAARLLGTTAGEVQRDRAAALERLCALCPGATLLKGQATLIGKGYRRARNDTGNPGMATAGSGDVLSGVIGALLAAGVSAFDAARLGADIHGSAGDRAAARLGFAGLTAVDLIDELPRVVARLEAAPGASAFERA